MSIHYHLTVSVPRGATNVLFHTQTLKDRIHDKLVDAKLVGHVISVYMAPSPKQFGVQRLSRLDTKPHELTVASVIYKEVCAYLNEVFPAAMTK